MNWWLAALGVLLILTATFDALWTTTAPQGGGPLTARFSRALWSGAQLLHQRRWTHRVLTAAGPIILLSSIVMWIALLWVGYFCLFSADPTAVVHATTNAPTDALSRIYFAGFTIFTLGTGDIVPQGAAWQVLTALGSVNGLFLVTLAITYLIPVISAAAAKRQLAATIAGLGMTPTAILRDAWNGTSFQGLAQYLAQITPLIELHAQRHLAYPMLHFFHSTNHRTAIAPRMAALDEALRLLCAAVEPQASLAPGEIQPARRAISSYLNTLSAVFIHRRDTVPPIPPLAELRTLGIPVRPTDEWRAASVEAEQHRRLMLALVQDDGWTWEHVTQAE